MKCIKQCLLTFFLLFPLTVKAGGIPVFSAVEHSQSLLTHMEVIEDAIVQLEKLGVMDEQLITQFEQLATQYQQLNLAIQNAQDLDLMFTKLETSDISAILENIMASSDRVKQLDPRNPGYQQVMRQEVDQKYEWEEIPNHDGYGGYGADKINQFNQLRYEQERAVYEDALTRRSAENELAKERKEIIGKYGERIENLGANSSLQTQQMTTSQINFLLSQQEEIISRLDQLNTREEDRDMKVVAEKRRIHQERMEKIEAIRNRKPLGTHLN